MWSRLLIGLLATFTAACTEGKAADSSGPVTLTNACLQTGGSSTQVDTLVTCQMTAVKRTLSPKGSCYMLTVEGCTEIVTANKVGVGTALTKIVFVAGDGNTQDGFRLREVGDLINTRQVQGKEIVIGFKGAVAQPDPASAYYYVEQPNGELTLE